MGTPDKPNQLSRLAAMVFRRFVDLPDRDQFQIYEAITDYLAARNPSVTPDKKVLAQAGAVVAILRVAEHLGIQDPTDLHNQAFNAAPVNLRDGWTVARVIKAHGTWNAAKAVAAGETAVTTARQRSVRRARASQRIDTDEHIAAVRDWLDSDPPSFGTEDYRGWAQEWNASRPEGMLRKPGLSAIKNETVLPWQLVLKVARRELTLSEAQKQTVASRAKGGKGEFVTSQDLVALSGRTWGGVQGLIERDDFPTCVLKLEQRRYWLRSDVEAFLKGEPFPTRKLHELNGLYIERNEAAAILGVSRDTIRRLNGRPEPRYRGGRLVWLKSDIEAFREERQQKRIGGVEKRRRKAAK